MRRKYKIAIFGTLLIILLLALPIISKTKFNSDYNRLEVILSTYNDQYYILIMDSGCWVHQSVEKVTIESYFGRIIAEWDETISNSSWGWHGGEELLCNTNVTFYFPHSNPSDLNAYVYLEIYNAAGEGSDFFRVEFTRLD